MGERLTSAYRGAPATKRSCRSRLFRFQHTPPQCRAPKFSARTLRASLVLNPEFLAPLDSLQNQQTRL
jgi:hypothetical protein